jgi:hypothetical protein
VCLLGSATLVGCTPSLQGISPSATPSAGAKLSPAWTAILDQIGPNGEVSLATALQAYTLGFGPLPGVPAPARDSGVIPSGTLAVDMILSHFDELTAAQQQAVLQRLGYAGPASAQVSPAATARVVALAQAQSHRVAPPAPTPVPTDAPGTADYRAMLDEFIPKLNTLLKVTLTLPTVLDFNPTTPFMAYTKAYDALGQQKGVPVLCRISLSPQMNTPQLDNQRLVVAHELTHCYQDQIQGPLSIHYASPAWLIEGSATWTGALVSGATAATSWLQPKWEDWLIHPEKGLFSRSYEAIGFYALLDQAGISPWSVLPAMYLSQTKGKVPDNLAAYQAATQSAPQEVLDEWASGYERDKSLGLDWDLNGPGIVAASAYGGPKIHAISLGDGQSVPVTTPAYTALDDDVTSQADVVQVSITGTSRLHDSASFERVTSANGSYCTKQGGCGCPPGSAYQGPALPQLSGLIHLAVTGGPQGATGGVSGTTLQHFCNTPPPTADATLCNIISLAEFSQVLGSPVTTLVPGVGHTPAAQEVVTCAYLPPSSPGHGGAIDFALSGNGAAYYAKLKQEEQSLLSAETDVTGIGDAAFWGTESLSPEALDFDLVKGNWVVGMVIDGSAPSGSAYLAGAEQMAKEIASKL